MQIERVLQDLVAMVKTVSINPYDEAVSPGYGESFMVDFLAGRMRDLGMHVSMTEVAPGRSNVWGRLSGRGGGPTLMLAGHMDTVAVDGYDGDPFSGRVADGRVYGRGSVDMKGALACFLEVARLVRDDPGAGDLVLMFVCDEEHHMIGSKAARPNIHGADLCIVGEPSLLGVCHKHPGQHIFPYTIEGKAVHSSRPEKGINAIVGASELVARLADYADILKAREPDPDCGHARVTPVLIEGGESHSTVPGQCLLQVDRRVLPGESEAEVAREMLEIAESFNGSAWNVSLGAPAPATPALNMEADADVTRRALSAVTRITGQKSELSPFPGGTDAPNFGCPAVICGPGDLAQAHTINEYIAIDQLEAACRIYLDIYRHLERPNG